MRFKVGDRVRIKSLDWYNKNKDNYGTIYAGNGFCFWKNMTRHCGEIMKITTVKVDPEDSNKGFYFMENSDEKWTDEMIEGLVEDEVLKQYEVPTGSIKIWDLPNGYQFKDENGNVINATKIVLEKKKKKYPKTYEECCKVLDIDTYDLVLSIDYRSNKMKHNDWKRLEKLNALNQILICRDAYWKIAGEEMGLGKHWEPDWEGEGWYVIVNHRGDIVTDIQWHANAILALPTEEMRDAFYENFKKEINSCKELL